MDREGQGLTQVRLYSLITQVYSLKDGSRPRALRARQFWSAAALRGTVVGAVLLCHICFKSFLTKHLSYKDMHNYVEQLCFAVVWPQILEEITFGTGFH